MAACIVCQTCLLGFYLYSITKARQAKTCRRDFLSGERRSQDLARESNLLLQLNQWGQKVPSSPPLTVILPLGVVLIIHLPPTSSKFITSSSRGGRFQRLLGRGVGAKHLTTPLCKPSCMTRRCQGKVNIQLLASSVKVLSVSAGALRAHAHLARLPTCTLFKYASPSPRLFP